MAKNNVIKGWVVTKFAKKWENRSIKNIKKHVRIKNKKTYTKLSYFKLYTI